MFSCDYKSGIDPGIVAQFFLFLVRLGMGSINYGNILQIRKIEGLSCLATKALLNLTFI